MAKSNLFKLIACTYQVVTWNDGTTSHQYSTRKTMQCRVGESAYFALYDDGTQELLSASNVDSLGDSKDALLSAPLPATM